ncbi:MAG: serine/threonine-protein kinase [Isosphaeraceae bacterium]
MRGGLVDFYERDMGPLLFPAANEVLAEGTFDLLGPRGSRLVLLSELRTRDDGRAELGLRDLIGTQGERAAALVLDPAQASTLRPGRVAVLWPGRPAPMPLDPLLAHREGELAEEVLFLNRDRNGKQVEYLSYTTGRTERDRSFAPALAALLTRVANRPVGTEDLDRLAEQSHFETASVEALLPVPPPTSAVLGDYEVLAEVGRGAMGVVYLARQLSLGRLVALKLLPGDREGDEVTLARFRREMRLLARCDHPNIVKILACGTLPDGRLYYAMEYIPGCDLEHLWRVLSGSSAGPEASSPSLGGSTWDRALISATSQAREAIRPASPSASLPLTPLPDPPPDLSDPGGYIRRVVTLVRDAARAVQAVHDRQVIHRDVKPANLMLTPDGSRVVLMDFGLAKGESRSASVSESGGFIGTLRYAAPEQLAAATITVGPAADVRALGVILWELLTRRRLFAEAEDERQLATMLFSQDVPRLRSIDKQFDRDLDAIVSRATERRPEDRVVGAGRLAELLQLYLDGQPLPIRPPSAGELLKRWVRTHKSVAALLFTLLAVVVGAFLAIVDSGNKAFDLAIKNADLAKNKEELAAMERETRVQAQKNFANAQVNLARSHMERGLAACEKDESLGLLWLANGLTPLYHPDLPDYLQDSERGFLSNAIRLNISAWAYRVHSMANLVTHDGPLFAAVISPDGETILTASEDRTARLWSARDGSPVGAPMGHNGAVRAAAFSPDGRTVVTASEDKTARLWSARDGSPVGPPMEHGGTVFAAAFSPDGRTIVTGSDDRTARVWSARDGSPVGPPIAHQSEVLTVAFSPDGTAVLTGGADGTARLWHAPRVLEGPPERIQVWVEVITGKRLGDDLRPVFLNADEWRSRRRRLQELGGPPGPR